MKQYNLVLFVMLLLSLTACGSLVGTNLSGVWVNDANGLYLEIADTNGQLSGYLGDGVNLVPFRGVHSGGQVSLDFGGGDVIRGTVSGNALTFAGSGGSITFLRR